LAGLGVRLAIDVGNSLERPGLGTMSLPGIASRG